jgi:phosphoribosylformylglycinamidine cyclo-ligase
LAGGETADVGDIVRTIDVGITAFGRIKKEDVIEVNVQAGDVIVGFASYGQATYETAYNGGMGSNGLTSARHDVLAKVYKTKYPESFDSNIDDSLVYCGSRLLTESITLSSGAEVSIGQLLLSPTRTYLPLLKDILALHRSNIHGLIHCTGGAQTKVMKFVKNKRILKDNLLPIPELFQLIESESATPRREMYEVFNMGHRLECYTDIDSANQMIQIAKKYNIDAQIIGRVEQSDKNELIISDDKGEYIY